VVLVELPNPRRSTHTAVHPTGLRIDLGERHKRRGHSQGPRSLRPAVAESSRGSGSGGSQERRLSRGPLDSSHWPIDVHGAASRSPGQGSGGGLTRNLVAMAGAWGLRAAACLPLRPGFPPSREKQERALREERLTQGWLWVTTILYLQVQVK